MRGFQATRKILGVSALVPFGIAPRVGLVHRIVHGGAHPFRHCISDGALLMRVAALNQDLGAEGLDDRFLRRLRTIDHYQDGAIGI